MRSIPHHIVVGPDLRTPLTCPESIGRSYHIRPGENDTGSTCTMLSDFESGRAARRRAKALRTRGFRVGVVRGHYA